MNTTKAGFQAILEKVKGYQRIIIHRHEKPDGDAIGAQVGLKHILKENFPEKEILAVGDPAGRYGFIPDSVMDDVADGMYHDALAVVLDTSAKALISDERYLTAKDTVRLDHHIFCEPICALEVTDTGYESCCGLVTDFAVTCGLSIPQVAAQALYTGMVTDSGRFRYDATTANTFRLAAHLMEVGVNTNELYRQLYANDFDMMRLRAQFVMKIAFTPNRVAYIYTTKEEAAAIDADTFTISRSMVSTMADIRGVDIWVNFTETEGGILCELRSSRYNINPVAVKYGGGGHAKASGATLKTKDEAMQMLSDLDALAGENE